MPASGPSPASVPSIGRAGAGLASVCLVSVCLVSAAWTSAARAAASPSSPTTPDTSAAQGAATDPPATAEPAADAPSYHADLESWLYGEHNWLMPGVRGAAVFSVPTSEALVDERMDLRLNAGAFDAELLPRLVLEKAQDGRDPSTHVAGSGGNLRFTEAFARVKRGDDTVVAGREVLTWGPASFRSPSNPFYFDAGRTNPLGLTPGVDLVRVTHQAHGDGLTMAYVRTGQAVEPQGEIRRAWLAKADEQGDSHLVSVVGAWTQDAAGHRNGFVGSFAQFTPSDAWLVYGEAGVQRHASAGERSLAKAALAGASYTDEAGRVFSVEYLDNDNGDPTPSALPRLQGRHYAWAGWHSNPQETRLYWRVEYQADLDDGSGQLLYYVEKNFTRRLNGFFSADCNFGNARSEYGRIARSSVALGVKLFGF